jgi:precorrin-6B C5,15-methyltransferase / cobalt-precorrin-6B C5,C15-methyltransferase
MSAPIHVIGVGADGPAGLQPEQVERILGAAFLAGGERHLACFPQARGERFVIKGNLGPLSEELLRRHPRGPCVVLASGDPLFYGVGKYLVAVLGRENVRVEPALSSMQLAFARAGLPWEGAALASVHGRDLRKALLPLLGRWVIGLFTHDGDSPAAVARFFLARGLGHYEATVGENLGAAEERVSRFGHLEELTGRRFGPLNYLVLNRALLPVDPAEVERNRAFVPGVPDELFTRPESGPEVMTRQEVRAVALAKLLLPTQPGATVWDVGAGLGTVSVEVAVLRPDVEVVAVERDLERANLLRTNRERFGAYNVRVLRGAAPEALREEQERPRLIFLGGSGGRLAELLPFLTERLQEGGRLVGAFVTLENLGLALQHFRGLGWPLEVTEVQVARSDALAGLTGLRPQRGVFLLRADKPPSGEGERA